MLDAETYKRLVQEAPEAVMVRAVLEHSLESDAVDEVFDECRDDQYTRTLLFSSVVGLMTLVVCRVRRSVSAAYQMQKYKLAVSLKSIYNKLNATDVDVCEGLFLHSAEQMQGVLQELNASERPLIPGYSTRILDGNQWAATEHRSKELRFTSAGPLPGKALVVWNADLGLISDVYCCEDSYTQERKICARLMENVQADEVWIADRNFCTSPILWGISQRDAYFVIRRHAKNVRIRKAGREQRIGETDTAILCETPVIIEAPDGTEFRGRLIRGQLHQKTRDGDASIEILTNLPADVSAIQIAEAYRQRWQIETVFFDLDRVFNGEIKTLAHPGAAMLVFCMSLIAYNALRVVRVAMGAVHGQEAAEQVSDYYLTEAVFPDWRALDIFVTPDEWIERFGHLSAKRLARDLKQIAKHVDMTRIRKSTRGPTKKPPKRRSNKRKPHLSTHRVLQATRWIKRMR